LLWGCAWPVVNPGFAGNCRLPSNRIRHVHRTRSASCSHDLIRDTFKPEDMVEATVLLSACGAAISPGNCPIILQVPLLYQLHCTGGAQVCIPAGPPRARALQGLRYRGGRRNSSTAEGCCAARRHSTCCRIVVTKRQRRGGHSLEPAPLGDGVAYLLHLPCVFYLCVKSAFSNSIDRK